MNRLLCALALTLTLGCTKAVFRPYVGSQQSWPTAEGSIVNTRYKLPIFTNLPPSPYEVLGEIRIESMLYAQPEEHHMPLVCKKADELGGDAVLFVQGRIYFSTNYGPRPGDLAPVGGAPTLTQVNTFNPESFKEGVTILAIKWLGEPPPGLPINKRNQPAEMPAEPVPVPVELPPVEPAAELPPPPAIQTPAVETPAVESPSDEVPPVEDPMGEPPAMHEPVEDLESKPAPSPTE